MNVRLLNTCTTFMLAALWLPFDATCSDNWPQFRGPSGLGIAPSASKPPVSWNSRTDSVWQTELPGTGWSSPVFDDGKIWLTTAVTTEASPEQIEEKRKGVTDPEIKTVADSVEFRVLCVDLENGGVIHDKSLLMLNDPELINPLNSYASPTPALHDGRVVCHFGNYGTWCLDTETAEVIWKVQYIVDHSVGPGSSPVIVDDNVILVCDGTDEQYIVAVDLSSGEKKWLTKRPPIVQDNGEYRKSFCTPLMIKVAGRSQMVIPGAQWIASYNPRSGAEIWRARHGEGFSIAPMPVYESGLVVFSTGYIRPEFVAVDPTGTGDITQTHIRCGAPGAPTMPSMVSHDGQVFAITEKGILKRIDAESGNVLEQARIGGNHSASPLMADGKLYLSSREGVVTVVAASVDRFSTAATNRFEGRILASPAVFQNDLIVRTDNKLYRIASRSH